MHELLLLLLLTTAGRMYCEHCWRAGKSINFILKSYLCLTMRKSDTSLDLLFKYLLIMELRFAFWGDVAL